MPNLEHARAHRESIAELIGEGEDDDGGLAPDIEDAIAEAEVRAMARFRVRIRLRTRKIGLGLGS